jgi:glutathione synthase/RimK-type ligase-like ATP-grasp enzyme
MKKTIAIFCDSLAYPGVTFEKESYWEAYSDLLLLLRSRGVKAYFVSDNTTYLGRGIFTEGYTLTRKGRPENLIRVPFIRADVVYNRGSFTGDDLLVINPREVYRLGSDKIAMYEELREYQAFSAICADRTELETALAQIKTDLVVVKKPVSFGGHDVYIGTRKEVLGKMPRDNYPLLAQEFMDTSVGVPGFVKGMHDLRIEMGNGQVWACYLRTPKDGEYRANVALGGTATYIPHTKVPEDVAELARRIDARFGSQPRHYALDFANTPDGWKLIELNSQPGLVPLAENEMVKYAMLQLADYLAKVTRKTRTPLYRKAMAWPVSAAHLASEYEKALGVSVKRLTTGRVVMTFSYPNGARVLRETFVPRKYFGT